MSPDSDSDRGRGFLTPTDREFLTGDRSEYEDASIRQKWYRINRRIRNAILDFGLLLEHLPSDRLGMAFYPDDDDDRKKLWDGVRAVLALLFLQQYEEHKQMDLPESWDVDRERFLTPKVNQNRLVEAGLRRALESRGESLHEYEQFDYRTAPLNLKDLWRRFNSGEPLSLEEFETLQREATTADIRWQARVVNDSAFSPNEKITEGDDLLLPRERQLVWNRSLDEFDKTDWADEDISDSEGSAPDADAN